MNTGKIKTLTEKGFGFIRRGEGKKDLFFHFKGLEGITFDELRVGDEMQFNIESGDKGPFATNVERIATA